MLGHKDRDQGELFITGSLRQLLPDDHILVRVDRVLDLTWLRGEVADLYCADNGRPGIDPEAVLRLMLAGFLLGIVHDRRLLREAQVNLAIRWFAGYGLHEALPDHSSLTRIRQRWGPERFRRIFQRSVQACFDARIATGEVVHVDASLIRADVSWESGASLDPSGGACPRASRRLDPGDAGKKVVGRERHVLTDTLGLLLAVIVHPANVQDRDGAESLLQEARRSFPFIERIIAGAGYQGRKMEAAIARTGTWCS